MTNEGRSFIIDKVIVVEGKNDKRVIELVLGERAIVLCTFGTMSEYDLEQLLLPYEGNVLFTFFDRDDTGDRLREQTDDLLFEATHLHVPEPFVEVERLPLAYVRGILEEAGIQTKGGGKKWPIKTGR